VQLEFADADTAYSVLSNGSSALFKSVDGGVNWKPVKLDFLKGLYSISDVQFVTPRLGHIVVYRFIPERSDHVYRTEDGGRTWMEITPDKAYAPFGSGQVYFTSSQKGHLALGSKLYSTSNAGESWSLRRLSNFVSSKDMHFFDDNRGVLGGWDGSFAYRGLVYVTNDGGASWDSLTPHQFYTDIRTVQYLTENRVIAFTESLWNGMGRMFVSTDQGNSWDTILISRLTDSLDQATGFHFFSPKIGMVTTIKGYVYRTDDGGENWQMLADFNKVLVGFHAYKKDIYVIGRDSVIYTNPSILSAKVHRPLEQAIYPNPASSNQLIQTHSQGGTIWHILTIEGREMAALPANTQGFLPLGSVKLAPGMYLLQAEGRLERVVIKP